MEVEDILKPFALKRSNIPDQIFGNDIVRVSSEIRYVHSHCDYDHRPFLPIRDMAFPYLLTEEMRKGYACFKYAVAKVLQPKTILEIGMGAGTGAIAMLHGAPGAFYTGVDDNSKCKSDGFDFTGFVEKQLKILGASHSIYIKDSMTIEDLPKNDLFHVDGDHSYENAFHDCLLAFKSKSPWILVDDARDKKVMRGAFIAIQSADADYEWSYFEDTWTGNLLLHRLD